MKVLIVSDTHKRNENYLRVIEKEAPLDMVIHCGDAEGSELLISEGAGCRVEIVLGNNDFFSELPKELELEIGKYKVLVTHGHNYCVSIDNEEIKQEAKSREKNIIMYGHTHRPLIELEGDIIAINPGSLSYPRQDGKKPSYVIMTLDEDGEAGFCLKYVE